MHPLLTKFIEDLNGIVLCDEDIIVLRAYAEKGLLTKGEMLQLSDEGLISILVDDGKGNIIKEVKKNVLLNDDIIEKYGSQRRWDEIDVLIRNIKEK